MTVLYLLGGLWVLAMIVFIVSENRRPQSTFAWMFLLAFVPGLGLLVYFLFGREMRGLAGSRHLVHQDLEQDLERALASLRAQHERALERLDREAPHQAGLVRLVNGTANALVTVQNRLELLQDAAETYPRLMADLKAARISIHLQYYSWSSDELGQELKSILLAKAAEGVEVRLLYDPLGSLLMLKRRYLREMRAGGVAMQPFSRLWRLHTISYRNHRKIAVIDGRVGYTGGLNIGHEHVDPGPEFHHRWRDTHLRLEGTTVGMLQAVFCVDWRNATDEDLLSPAQFAPLPPEAAGAHLPVQVSLSGPDSDWAAIRQLYFAMIGAARRRVRIQSPFFILDDSLSEALSAAALRGVDVQVMISERGTGQILPYWAANTYFAEVARAGVKVLLFRHGYLHAKTLGIDGEVCSVGSANMDIRSFSINYELNAVIYDPATAQALEAAFDRDLADCVPFDPEEYARRSRLHRFRDSALRLLSPLY
ncbi:cardiolipin synthase [Paracoccus sp. YIM 132242]|uniref:Cardiolipin synthase n=1 Tax=Paracoccus lichenicola TaxID=2665644 RepID=A0A6L6HUZ6_9RHOB|nr:cardiolipin synthase [Paracoccus lichenicola]MTE01108.1 cardiolipin synthase [Paracoccus lichenicola]